MHKSIYSNDSRSQVWFYKKMWFTSNTQDTPSSYWLLMALTQVVDFQKKQVMIGLLTVNQLLFLSDRFYNMLTTTYTYIYVHAKMGKHR